MRIYIYRYIINDEQVMKDVDKVNKIECLRFKKLSRFAFIFDKQSK